MIRKIWNWPDGLLWKYTSDFTLKSRRAKYHLFMRLMKPTPDNKILDVGVAPHFFRGTNFLEYWYPNPENITAIANENFEEYTEFTKAFPKVRLIFGDGRSLDFDDDSFDIVFSNAVVEHAGYDVDQKKFVHELCRVGKKIFITTPSQWFPFDSHTLLPFVHWFPDEIKNGIYKSLKLDVWSNPRVLNLLSIKRFKSLFPKGIPVCFYKQRFLGMTGNLIAVVDKGGFPGRVFPFQL